MDFEVLEWCFLVLLESFVICFGSGGKGLYKGGNGVVWWMCFLEFMIVGILLGYCVVFIFGLNGGGDGLVGKNYVEWSNGKVEELGGIVIVEMNIGDVFVIEILGGGGNSSFVK